MLSCSCCSAILFYCSVRDWARFCYVIGLENFWIHPFTRCQVRLGVTFSTMASGLSHIRIHCRIRRMPVDGSRIRKEKHWGFKNIRMRVDGTLRLLYTSRFFVAELQIFCRASACRTLADFLSRLTAFSKFSAPTIAFLAF